MVASTPKHASSLWRRGQFKRRQILDGARKVFMDLGFDGASMDEIARAAGVSKGTLYVYFADKSRLFEAMVEDECSQKAKIAFDLIPGAMSKPRCGSSAGPNPVDVPARRRIGDPYRDGDCRTDAGGRPPLLWNVLGNRSTASPTIFRRCGEGSAIDDCRAGRVAIHADVPGDAVPAVRFPGRAGALGGAIAAWSKARRGCFCRRIGRKAR